LKDLCIHEQLPQYLLKRFHAFEPISKRTIKWDIETAAQAKCKVEKGPRDKTNSISFLLPRTAVLVFTIIFCPNKNATIDWK